MSEAFLDLRDKVRVIDFLADHLEFAPPKVRADAEKWIHAYEDNEKVPTDKLADAARKFAWAIWPARFAVDTFFAADGSEEEWRRVLATVRPSTSHLLNRFRKGTDAKTLDDTLNHLESDVALHDGERLEIEEVRKHLRQDYWRDKKKSLAAFVKDAEQEEKKYHERLDTLRDLSNALPRTLQDEVVSKINRYEDQILFEGKEVPVEVLDEEIKYYTEQKEISPLEG